MSRTAKLALALVAALGVVAGGYYWLAAREIAVRTVPVQTGVEVRVFGVGSVEAQLVSKVGFQVAANSCKLRRTKAIWSRLADRLQSSTILCSAPNS